DLPVVHADAEHVAVIAEVEEEVAWALLFLAGEIRQQAHAVDVILVRPSDRFVTLLELVDDVESAGHVEERRQPIVMLDDLVADRAGCDSSGPTHDHRHTERALPVRVLLAAERRGAGIGPRVAM